MKFATTLSLCLVISLASGCKKKDANKAAEPAGSAAMKPAEPAGSAAKPAEPAGSAAATPPPAGDMTMAEACDKSIAMLTAMASVVESNKGKCDAMGDAFEKWAADNKGLIEWGKAQEKDPAKQKEFDAVCDAKLKPAMEKLAPAMEGAGACATNEKVKAALANLE